jgi:hypothetical protein
MLLSAFAAGLLLALSACGEGGGTNKSAAVKTSASKTTASHPQTTAVQHTAPPQGSSTQTESPVPATPTTTAEASALPAAECRRLDTLAARMGQAFTGRTPAADTRAYAAALQRLAKTAPTDVRDDFGVLADAYSKIAGAVAAAYSGTRATPTSDQLKQLSDVGRELNTGAINRAASNVNVWLQQTCAR